MLATSAATVTSTVSIVEPPSSTVETWMGSTSTDTAVPPGTAYAVSSTPAG